MQLAKPPRFFREIPPQQRKQTKWEPVDDFTDGQALLCRYICIVYTHIFQPRISLHNPRICMLMLNKYNSRHEVTFPPGALDKHYEKLLLNDERLARVSRRLFPTNGSDLPLQQIPQQQHLHHSLNANIIATSGIVTNYLYMSGFILAISTIIIIYT